MSDNARSARRHRARHPMQRQRSRQNGSKRTGAERQTTSPSFRHDSFPVLLHHRPKSRGERTRRCACPHVSQREAPSLSMDTIRRLTGWRSYRKEQTNKETDGYDLKRLKNLPSEPVASPTGRARALRTQDSPAVNVRL